MANISVMDTDFNIVGVLDYYESFIWTDRFRTPGDFEIYTPVDSKFLNLCLQDRYLLVDFSLHNMIIEEIDIETSAETGQNMIIRGRSLESILDRRIVWNQTVIGGTTNRTLEAGIKKLIDDAIISPGQDYQDRKISNFKFKYSEADAMIKMGGEWTAIRDLPLDKTEFTGDQLDVIIQDICESYDGLGYRILFGYQMKTIYGSDVTDASGNTLNDYDFVFELYSGVDLSYEQDVLPYVVFSPDFDNIINTNYIDTIASMKNVTLVLGEGEGASRKRLIVGSQDGLMRRELYTDARDLQSSEYGTKAKYQAAMKQRGLEKLVENSRTTSYEGEVEATRSFVYGRDFFMGDIIQIKNEYGISGNSRVIEWVRSESDAGIEVYPTFDGIQLIDDTTTEDGGWS